MIRFTIGLLALAFVLGLGDGSENGILNFGADGTIAFPPGLQLDLGPVPLLPVGAGTPKGSSAFSCRFVDPVTGASLTLDEAPFEIQ